MDKNDIIGERLMTKPATDLFREGWDRMFGKHYYIHNQPDQVNVHILSATAKLEDNPEILSR